MIKISDQIKAAKKAAELKKTNKSEESKSLKGLQRQFQLFGKTIKISELQSQYEFMKINQSHLIDVISWAINTIKNKSAVKGQDLNKQYYRNFLKWNELRDHIRKL